MWLLLLLLACNTGSLEPAEEVCNGLDDDGDGEVDEDAVDAPTWYRDQDGDGFGSPTDTVRACEAREDWYPEGLDCNDEHAGIHPGAAEIVGDEVDQDCDEAEICYVDADGDGWRPDQSSVVESPDHGCQSPGEAVASAPVGDCDDTDPNVNPGAEEVCGGTDEDCDGQVDEDPADASTWYPDADGDGFGAAGVEPAICPSPGWVETGGDCDDADRWVHPGSLELCDGQANACESEWSVGQERGVVTLFQEDGATDLSVEAGASLALEPLVATVGSGETLALCSGEYFVELTLEGEEATLLGVTSAGEVVLRGGDGDQVVASSSTEALIQDVHFQAPLEGTECRAILQESGSLTVRGCGFDGLREQTQGGAAIYQQSGTTKVEDSTFVRSQSVESEGGAIWTQGDLEVEDCTFRDNTARYGGAVDVAAGTLTCTCSTSPCGFYENSAWEGGAAWVSDSVTSTDCDWSGNIQDDLYVDGESYSDLGLGATFTYP